MKARYYFWSLAILTLASCGKDDDLTPNEPAAISLAPVTIQVSEEAATRAANIQDNQFWVASGATVPVSYYISENSTGTNLTTYSNPVSGTATANNATVELAFGSTQWWPSSGSGINISAWYPAVSADNGYDTTNNKFTIRTNQNTSANYAKSDLIVSAKKAISRPSLATTAVATNPFYHLLSRIHFTLTSSDGSIATAHLQGATVTLNGIKTTVGVNFAEGTIGTTDATTANVSVAMESGTTGGYCVIPPQDLGSKTITVALINAQNSTVFTATLASSGYTFATKKAYLFTIDVKSTGITLFNTTITQWGSETAVTGEATF